MKSRFQKANATVLLTFAALLLFAVVGAAYAATFQQGSPRAAASAATRTSTARIGPSSTAPTTGPSMPANMNTPKGSKVATTTAPSFLNRPAAAVRERSAASRAASDHLTVLHRGPACSGSLPAQDSLITCLFKQPDPLTVGRAFVARLETLCRVDQDGFITMHDL